jgi:hypothetical protein
MATQWNEDSIPDLERILASATSDQIEKYLRSEIKYVVDELRIAQDMSDEEIFDAITENMGGSLSEFETTTLAQILGIA